MGLLKDIYDIFASERKAKAHIEKAVLDFLAGHWWKASPTGQERKANLRPLIAQVTKDDFASQFEDLQAFFGALLGMTVEVVHTAGMGCLVEKLFLPGYCFYFPPPAKEPSLAKGETKITREVWRGLIYEDKSPYVFYAICPPDESAANIPELRTTLKNIALTNPVDGEAVTFVRELTKQRYEVVKLTGISRPQETASLHYQRAGAANVFEKKLQLNYVDAPATKMSLANELNELLDFKLV